MYCLTPVFLLEWTLSGRLHWSPLKWCGHDLGSIVEEKSSIFFQSEFAISKGMLNKVLRWLTRSAG